MPGKCHIVDRRRNVLRIIAQNTVGTLLYPAYRAAFNSRRKRFLAKRAPLPGAPVIGVGGISLGGSGKTPVVCALRDIASLEGKRGAVVMKLGADTTAYFDEFMLYATRFADGGVPRITIGKECVVAECGGTVVCAHRSKIEGARMMAAREGVDYVIVDDAHQLFSLQPALSFCLLHRRDVDGKPFPRGMLREEPSACGRADVILVRDGSVHIPGVDTPQMTYILKTSGIEAASRLLIPWHAGANAIEEMPTPKAPVVFAGIGKPDEFEQTMRGAGAQACTVVRFGDHHSFSLRDLRLLEKLRARKGADGFVTTEKDACRLLPMLLRALHGEGENVALPEELMPPPAHYLPDLIVAAQEVWERLSFLRVDAALPQEAAERFLKAIGA